MSLKELQKDFDENIKPQIEEILKLLKANTVSDNIEAAAAKVITELKPLIQECHCKNEILQVLKQKEPEETQIIKTDDSSPTSSRPWRYSYPNFSVGNEELGTGKNPGSMTWPFTGTKPT